MISTLLINLKGDNLECYRTPNEFVGKRLILTSTTAPFNSIYLDGVTPNMICIGDGYDCRAQTLVFTPVNAMAYSFIAPEIMRLSSSIMLRSSFIFAVTDLVYLKLNERAIRNDQENLNERSTVRPLNSLIEDERIFTPSNLLELQPDGNSKDENELNIFSQRP